MVQLFFKIVSYFVQEFLQNKFRVIFCLKMLIPQKWGIQGYFFHLILLNLYITFPDKEISFLQKKKQKRNRFHVTLLHRIIKYVMRIVSQTDSSYLIFQSQSGIIFFALYGEDPYIIREHKNSETSYKGTMLSKQAEYQTKKVLFPSFFKHTERISTVAIL